MKLIELLRKIGAEDQNISLLVDSEWVGVFPAMYSPREYDDYLVESFLPDYFNGASHADGLVLKIWVTET